MALSGKRSRFVLEYLVDLNASAAAIRAGYSASGARQEGHRLLQDPAVAAAIAKAEAVSSARTHISIDRIRRELARIAFSNVTDVMSWDGAGLVARDSATLCADVSASISEISETRTGQQTTRKAKQHNKLEAMRMLIALETIGANAGGADGEIGDDDDPPVAAEAAP